jgi:radical SAM superfamily enzyme YgiQ (UPF0313 family)
MKTSTKTDTPNLNLKCLLIYPRFTFPSFWNYRKTCELLGAQYPAAPLGMVTVAALLPESWDLKLIDCNVDELTEDHIQWADIVFSGGMISQQIEHAALIEKTKSMDKIHVVGGPDPTSSPHLYKKADHLVLGEAEVTLPDFLKDFYEGCPKNIYSPGDKKADISLSPVPRYDLIHFDRYLHVGIQFSRGCPFNCEFCDIIELFGRLPRVKKPEQILLEIQNLYDLGYRGHIDIVDDNFIANKKAAKELLPQMVAWQEKNKWPYEFSIEASMNIADDEELLNLMQRVGFSSCFVGIETPDKDVLLSTNKKTNLGRSISESIHTIYRHGMIVNAGYIVGFDQEKESVADKILECIENTYVPANMVGLLFALPNTQLTRRLADEGRLGEDFDMAWDDAGDQCLVGLNYQTLRPRDEIMSDFRKIVSEAYKPKRYFSRVRKLIALLDCSSKRLKTPIKTQFKNWRGFLALIKAMGIKASYRRHFWHTLAYCLIKNPKGFRFGVVLAALYLHFGPFTEQAMANLDANMANAYIEKDKSLTGVEPFQTPKTTPSVSRPQ